MHSNKRKNAEDAGEWTAPKLIDVGERNQNFTQNKIFLVVRKS